MDLFNFAKKVTTGFLSEAVSRGTHAHSDRGEQRKSINQWDDEWICMGPLKSANLTPYNQYVGLYRHVISGKTMYVGRAVEWNNGGFRKRLSDYRRASNSARTHKSGRLIHEHLDEIITYILITGSDAEAAELAKKLEGQFIAKYCPPWNKMLNI